MFSGCPTIARNSPVESSSRRRRKRAGSKGRCNILPLSSLTWQQQPSYIGSTVAAVSCNRGRSKTLGPGVLVRILEKAHRRGRLTDCSFQLLRDVVYGRNLPGGGEWSGFLSVNDIETIQLLQAWIDPPGKHLDDCLDDLNESATSDDDQHLENVHELETDILWKQEASLRERRYKRGHLRSYGMAAGIDSRCPFDPPGPANHQPTMRRELKPLAPTARDLDMPGFLESFLRKHETFLGTSIDVREVSVKTKYDAVRLLQDVRRPSECRGQLYRRLVRALDQRAPPDQRLFTTHDDDPPHQYHDTEAGNIPLWMRGNVSRHMFGGGSDLFISIDETRLADFDPY